MRIVGQLRQLLRGSGFRKLFAVRLVGQCGDGMLQAGLASLFFFSPQSATSAAGVAAAFAVMLAPFTLVGPWAGVLLDRWSRRWVLVIGNIVRLVLAALLAGLVVGGPTWAVYTLALICLSVNRFLLAALSAGLPHVVAGEQLVIANSLVPTIGAGAAGVGGAIGLGISLLSQAAAPITLVATGCVFAASALLALRLRAGQLGPIADDARPSGWQALRTVASGMVAGARYLIDRRRPAYALAAMAISRFCYGVMFLASILISRNLLAPAGDTAAGLAIFGTILSASAVGFAIAAVITPMVTQRISPAGWIVCCLGIAAIGQVIVAIWLGQWLLIGCAALLGLAAQGAKIAVDTIVQSDVDDAYRGRAFSLYDVLYNAAFMAAAALAGFILPNSGYSAWVFGGLGLVYAAAAGWFALAIARNPIPRAVAVSAGQ